MKKNVIIIGAGFAGLSAACYLAYAGMNVTILEKNAWTGGRANTWRNKGFSFDLGPSWYWMPQIFENFFADFQKQVSNYYSLVRLNPSYRVYSHDDVVDIPASVDELSDIFEQYEPGSAKKLHTLLKQTKRVYEISMKTFVVYPHKSVADIFDLKLLRGGFELLSVYNGFSSVRDFLRQSFSHPLLLQILEFPIFFLGASARNIPSVYSLMNYVDFELGTWYPLGGFGRVASGFTHLAKELGVTIHTNTEVCSIHVEHGAATMVTTSNGDFFHADAIVCNAEYPHAETQLLSPHHQSYPQSYWEKKTFAPSALLMHMGINKKMDGLQHHTLFFHHNGEEHERAIFQKPAWPKKPLYYVASPSKTDPDISPAGSEACTLLLPLAPGLSDTKRLRDCMQHFLLQDLESTLGTSFQSNIVTKRLYGTSDFSKDFHAYKGNAYGLAQTLFQTANFRPALRSRKVKNLFYIGQCTVPGIGVPMVILSGKMAANQITMTYGK